MRPDARARNHPAWWAFLVHRLSGIALALFLPLHFWALGQALAGDQVGHPASPFKPSASR